jgi:hypothetical protein
VEFVIPPGRRSADTYRRTKEAYNNSRVSEDIYASSRKSDDRERDLG